MNEYARKQLEEQLTDELVERLSLHACFLVQRYFGLELGEGRTASLPGGETPGSLITLLIEKLLDGRNTWDPAKVPLEVYFVKNLEREVGHRRNSAEFRNYDIAGTAGLAGDDGATMPDFGTSGPDPRTAAEDAEARKKTADLIDQIEAEIGDDAECMQVFQEMYINDLKPADVATELGWQVGTVRNVQKRLRRILDRVKHRLASVA